MQEGSITAASKKLYISQPALSQTVRQVETELGAPLFNRDVRQLELTHAGQLYLEAARRMMNIDRSLHARIADDKGEVYGKFTLGISNQRGIQVLPLVLPDFFRHYPHVQIKLLEEGSGRLERLLTEGVCDVAFITTTSKSNSLHYVLIENEQLVLVANRSTALAQRFADGTTIRLSEARDEKFISMAEGHSVRIIQERLFEKYGMRPEILLETHNMEAAKAITARANAVFLVPSVYVPDTMADRYRVNIYRISDTDYERHFYFCYRNGMYLTRYQQDLVRLMCRKLGVPCALDGSSERAITEEAPRSRRL